MKFRGILLFATGLLVGGLVVPVAAQTDPAENQLVIRSDGFIFLIRGAQRHLVSPVALTDEQINGYPEGEPFLSGLAPTEALSAAPTGTFGGSPVGGTTSGSTPGSTTPATRAATPTSTTQASSGTDDVGFKLIPTSVKQNELFKVVVGAPEGSTCEGKMQFKGGKTAPFSSGRTSLGECKMEVTIPADARTGDADVKAVVRDGTQITEFEEVTEVLTR